ncbi:stage II sporulation protein M [Methanimicrococcus hacksteinii]|nr:stage II sporulation protein M [Methanimicrococcus sp. At1]
MAKNMKDSPNSTSDSSFSEDSFESVIDDVSESASESVSKSAFELDSESALEFDSESAFELGSESAPESDSESAFDPDSESAPEFDSESAFDSDSELAFEFDSETSELVSDSSFKMSLEKFLSQVSGPLFWSFFIFMILIFVFYALYVLSFVFIPIDPLLFSDLSGFFESLPAPISDFMSFVSSYHLSIAAFLAFLNFVASFADFCLSKKQIRPYLVSLAASYEKPLILTAVLFVLSLIIGCIAGSLYPEIMAYFFNLSGLPGDDPLNLVSYIFFNNVRIVFMLIFLGFVFGILPAAIIIVNGVTIGLVSEYTVKAEGILFLLVGLLPHGVIEIPVILLGSSVGFGLGMQAAKTISGSLPFSEFRKSFVDATWIFFLIAVPLLFIAAVIEVYVTGTLLSIAF